MNNKKLSLNNGNDPVIDFHDYLELRDEADSLCLTLEDIHEVNLKCKPGCHDCCMDFSIFPVEFYFILQETERRTIEIDRDAAGEECIFLIEGLCSIYESRPMICRTHGLPLLFMNDEEWQLSHCELNFTGEDIPEFSEKNTFPQDRFNSRLYMINRKFIAGMKEQRYSETDLIPLNKMIGDTL